MKGKSSMMTDLQMDWTDTGATVSYTSNLDLEIHCPRCEATVKSGVTHLCGDRLPAAKKSPHESLRPIEHFKGRAE